MLRINLLSPLILLTLTLGSCKALEQPYVLDAPSTLQYAGNTLSLNTGVPVNIIAPLSVVYGAKTCIANPALPAGLMLDSQTCAISGTPTALSAPASYTITATNNYGSSRGTLSLRIVGIAYSQASYSYTVGALTTINPTVSGSISSCAITPALISDLNFDTNTCAISGKPLTMQGVLTYTVSAANGNGMTMASITLIGDYAIGGTLSGILTSGIVLRKQNGGDLTVAANGAFTFATGTASGGAYSVSILTQPADTICTIQNSSGVVANAPVTNIIVTCPVGVKNGLLWIRCAHGQVWNVTAGNCTGTGNATNDIWGAVTVQYCNTSSNNCNDAIPLPTDDSTVYGHLNGSGSSGAWNACSNLNAGVTYGKNTWRVPRKSELVGLMTGATNPSIDTAMFPNTIYASSAAYWTDSASNSSVNYPVWFVVFTVTDGAVQNDFAKTGGAYVRCVSPP